MPDEEGLDLCRQARALPAYRTTPLIILTASRGQHIALLEAAGASLVLQKPFTRSQLLDAMRETLSTETPIE